MVRSTTLCLMPLAALGFASSASAAEYCVSCTGPDASYRCEVGGSAGDARGWLQCITELAKEGGHDSCSVDRKAASPCPGIHKVLAAPEGAAPLPPVQTATPIPPPVQPPPSPAAAPQPPGSPGDPKSAPAPVNANPEKKRVPQTMEELAGDVFDSSKDGLKKAGDSVSDSAKKAGDAVGDGIGKAGSAVGNAAKKTWSCLTSLFQDCGS